MNAVVLDNFIDPTKVVLIPKDYPVYQIIVKGHRYRKCTLSKLIQSKNHAIVEYKKILKEVQADEIYLFEWTPNQDFSLLASVKYIVFLSLRWLFLGDIGHAVIMTRDNEKMLNPEYLKDLFVNHPKTSKLGINLKVEGESNKSNVNV